MQTNPFAATEPDVTSSTKSAFVVTPSDSTNLTYYTRGIYIGVSGDLKVDMIEDGTAIVFKSLAVGWHPLGVRRIYATGTTATNIIGVQ